MRVVAVPFVLAVLLFGPAGRLTCTRGWLFLVVWVTAFDAAALDLWWINPEIFVARNSITREGTKGWGRILLAVLFPVILAIFIVAALDDGHFHRSRMPWWGSALATSC
jgi:hypothetical protein